MEGGVGGRGAGWLSCRWARRGFNNLKHVRKLGHRPSFKFRQSERFLALPVTVIIKIRMKIRMIIIERHCGTQTLWHRSRKIRWRRRRPRLRSVVTAMTAASFFPPSFFPLLARRRSPPRPLRPWSVRGPSVHQAFAAPIDVANPSINPYVSINRQPRSRPKLPFADSEIPLRSDVFTCGEATQVNK